MIKFGMHLSYYQKKKIKQVCSGLLLSPGSGWSIVTWTVSLCLSVPRQNRGRQKVNAPEGYHLISNKSVLRVEILSNIGIICKYDTANGLLIQQMVLCVDRVSGRIPC